MALQCFLKKLFVIIRSLLFRSSVVSIYCYFNQLSFDQLSFDQLSFDQLSFDQLSFDQLSFDQLLDHALPRDQQKTAIMWSRSASLQASKILSFS